MLVPAENELRIELKGNLAAMLSAAQNAKRSPNGDLLLQVAMVAGACNRRYLQLWSGAACPLGSPTERPSYAAVGVNVAPQASGDESLKVLHGCRGYNRILIVS